MGKKAKPKGASWKVWRGEKAAAALADWPSATSPSHGQGQGRQQNSTAKPSAAGRCLLTATRA